MNIGLLIGLIVGILVVGGGVGAFVVVRSRTAAVSARLDRYADLSAQGKTAQPTQQAPKASPIADRLNQAMVRRGMAAKIATDLAQADLKMTPAEWLALQAIVVVAVGFLGFFILFRGPQGIIFALLGSGGGFMATNMFMGFRKDGRRTKFNNQLADVLNLWVNALRSGYSVLQALDAMSKEMPAPAGVEFSRVVQEIRLGVSQEIALNNLLRRVPSDDLDLVVTAVNVQREVGGNLAEILEVIGHTIRERVRIKGEIETLTAQQMYGGYVISGLPIALAMALYAINPKYVGRLFSVVPCGWMMVCVGSGMIAGGFMAIQKIVKIDV